MKKKELIQLIDSYFHNTVQLEQVEKAIRELAEEENISEIDEVMKKHWVEASVKEMPDEKEFSQLLDQIHHRINMTRENEDIRILERKKQTEKTDNKSITTIIHKISRIAAVLFLPLLLTFAWYLYSDVHKIHKKKKETPVAYNEIYTPLSAKTRFVLPDSTVVWLNSGSRLKYPFSFPGKTREVYLTGEGYFEVAKNRKIPFIVKTDNLDITAYGTSFNVMAYPDDPTVETTLVNGTVKVESVKDRKYMFLKPNTQALFNKETETLKGYRVDTRFYTSWKDGKLIFRNQPLGIVAHKLERWFNCTIHIEDHKMKNYRYTGNIEMETLREVLELIQITTPVKYTYNKKTREIWIKSKK